MRVFGKGVSGANEANDCVKTTGNNGMLTSESRVLCLSILSNAMSCPEKQTFSNVGFISEIPQRQEVFCLVMDYLNTFQAPLSVDSYWSNPLHEELHRPGQRETSATSF